MREALLLLLLAGCASQPPLPGTAAGDCRRLFAAVDQAVASAGVADAASHRMPSQPALRSNRLLASYATELDDPAGYRAWLAALRQLDRQGREIEIANLPPKMRQELARLAGGPLSDRIEACGDSLTAPLRRRATPPAALIEAVQVPDHYRSWQRAAGLYPLAAMVAGLAIERLHETLRAPFLAPDPPRYAERIRYRPASEPSALRRQVARLRSVQTALPPLPDNERLTRLFQRHAPSIVVEQRGPSDRIGQPYWPDRQRPAVDTDRPTLYLHLAQTRFHGDRLLQLDYLFWFPARDTGDLYSGRFDGLIWRVTLGRDGRPVAYQGLHPCGCYHLLFPAAGYRARPTPAGQEPVLSPAAAPTPGANERIELWLAAGNHYLQRVSVSTATDAAARTYQWGDAGDLRSLPLPGGGRRSLFGPDGIIAASARPERLLLWPFGVANPGAMRQFGTHAIAFVGRRHFDAPFLLERLLEATTQ